MLLLAFIFSNFCSTLQSLLSLFILQLVAILPLAFVHTLGNLFTNMSLGKVSVSFTHTIKAMEPFFSVVLSAMFLGEVSISHVPFLPSIPNFLRHPKTCIDI